MDKERTKLFEMELKEKEKKDDLFPINIQKDSEEKKVNEIIEDMKRKGIEKENKKKQLEKEREEEEKIDY